MTFSAAIAAAFGGGSAGNNASAKPVLINPFSIPSAPDCLARYHAPNWRPARGAVARDKRAARKRRHIRARAPKS